ncbi:MAG: class I SAM-dependent methyltransferase family protein [Thermoplasmatales archaeon]|nr:MAG: class I SAM-dependent methyltransferase family protein [Thermoplasmatales archaeon]
MFETPLRQIKKYLSKEIPSELVGYLPEKWEKIGDVLIIKLNENLKKYQEKICKKYGEILRCKTVLNDFGGISGKIRKPGVEIVYGSKNTETVHIENGIRYKLDPKKIMFSSGNMDERIRMANISGKKENIVDLFAGIGYFTIPMAVYSKPNKIFACEISSIAYEYLCKNIVLNHVTSIVKPLFGDNRTKAPKNIADRVIMGYINDTYRFLPTAINCLKNHTGIIHYHDVFPNELIPDKPIKIIQETSEKYDTKARLLKYRHIKSYAPGVSHFVFDIQIGER